MLAGNGVKVRQLIRKIKSKTEHAAIRIYAPNGEEVFAEKGPIPSATDIETHVKNALAKHETLWAQDGLHVVPIPNQARCRSCHETGKIRGILSISTQNTAMPISDPQVLEQSLAHIAREGFEQIMSSDNVSELDDYFEEMVKNTPGLTSITVLNMEGEPVFGDDTIKTPTVHLTRALKPGKAFHYLQGAQKLHLTPLPNEARCQGCHEPEESMRGALLVGFQSPMLKGENSLLPALKSSLEHVMLTGLGRLIKRFLDQIAATGTVSTLTLHDEQGRLYHDPFMKQHPPAIVQHALSRKEVVSDNVVTGAGSEFVYVEPMHNEKQCRTCHGTDQPLRGAIEIRLDTNSATQARAALINTNVMLGVVTVVFVVLFLYQWMRISVVWPMQRIANATDHVGNGNLDISVDVQSTDEIGRLGASVNSMIGGLRQKLALSKFVSRETMRTVDASDGAIHLGGTRRTITVLFSDIRGFTAFSDQHNPEEVVSMLNRYLQAQANIVIQYGGDIDKYVGDELMARFDGPGMEDRALQCGVELVAAVNALSNTDADHTIHVGVGINVGEVVLGAMGSDERMDYTAIGDTVNLAARLCSAAKGGEVLVTQSMADAAKPNQEFTLERLEPILVKGKPDPVAIHSAVARTKSS